MKNLKYLLTAILFVTFAFSVQGQSQQKPVSWRISVKMTSKTEGIVTVKATPVQGWHFYGTTLPAGGPKPTSLDFSKSTGVKFLGKTVETPKPKSVHDDMFDLTLTWWDTTARFTRKFKVTDPAKAKVACDVTYMACNDQTCSMPETVSLTKQIQKAAK